MKRMLKSALAVILCLAMLLSTGAVAFAAQDTDGNDYSSVEDYLEEVPEQEESGVKVNFSAFLVKFKMTFAKIVNLISDLVLNDTVARLLSLFIPTSTQVQDYQSFKLDEYAGFYEGMDTFIDAPAAGAKWKVGYAWHSVMPENFDEKEYAKGAYLPYVYGNSMYKDDDGNDEELRVRTVILDDGSGRGSVVFAAVDCMGLANADVRKIRAVLSDFAEKNNIVSINISATHIHTGIDSQGVWTNPLGSMIKNAIGKNVTAVDEDFLNAIIEGVSQSVRDAYADMKTGKLYYSSFNIDKYVWDRTAPISCDENMYKLEFVPDSKTARPTVICSFGCHPESSSYDWTYKDEKGITRFDKSFSSDFIWYMEKIANMAGCNFIFIQGNVSTTTSQRKLSNDEIDGNAHDSAVRYGYEMGYICMTMNMTYAQRVSFNARTRDKLGIAENRDNEGYTVWYEDLDTVSAQEVEPVLNIASKQFFTRIENNVVTILGKGGMADNLVLKDKLLRYYTVTEVGYMEIGDVLKVYISPGETFTELLKGGSGLDGFPYKSIRETVGENTIIFDLCNDAAGYVANDVNHVMVGMQYNEIEDSFDDDTWCLFSYGAHEGSTFMNHFFGLVSKFR